MEGDSIMAELDFNKHMMALRNMSLLLMNNVSFPFNSPQEEDRFGFILYTIVVPILFGFVTLTGVIGNSLVIYIICSKQKMRTLTNLLLLNLAFADLSFVLICPPFTAYQFATYHWPFEGVFGDLVCKLMHYLLNVTAYVTIYTLVLIAALRYFTIVHSAATVRYRTKKVIGVLILGIWIIMLLCNVPIILSYGVQIDVYGIGDCEHYGADIARPLYATFFAFAYLLPLSIIAMFSLGILRHISNADHSASSLFKGTTRSEERKRHACRLVITVVIIFAIFWFPVHIHLLLAHFKEVPQTNFYNAVSVLFNFLAYFNSCINPVIYSYTSKDFRSGFYEAMCCCYRNKSTNSQPKHLPLVSIQKATDDQNADKKKETMVQITCQENLNSPTSQRSVKL